MYKDKAYRVSQRMRTDEAMLRKVMRSNTQNSRSAALRDLGRTPNCRGEYETGRENGNNGIHEAPSLAMVFSPIQVWRNVYDHETGLSRGTIFQELDKPWEIVVGRKDGDCCGN